MRTLTPERQTKAMEARNLRQAGFTQQQIAERLGAPRQSVSRWLVNMGNGVRGKVGNSKGMPTNAIGTMPALDITLYPMPYEKTEGRIPQVKK